MGYQYKLYPEWNSNRIMPDTTLTDSEATFHADMIGSLCYMTSGANAGECREIASVTGTSLTFVTGFDSTIAVGDRYCINPVPVKIRCWPLQMETVDVFNRWIAEGMIVKAEQLEGFLRPGLSIPIINDKWRLGFYRNNDTAIESATDYVDVTENPSTSAGALSIDGVDLEPYIEQISTGTKFELTDAEVIVSETDSREEAA